MSSNSNNRWWSCSAVKCAGGGWSPREEPRARAKAKKSRPDNHRVDRKITMELLREPGGLYDRSGVNVTVPQKPRFFAPYQGSSRSASTGRLLSRKDMVAFGRPQITRFHPA